MEVREKTNRDVRSPLCVFDVATELGVEVRFVPLPSVEGLYSPMPAPVIIVGSQRPPGRRAYTCAHELGHHVFGHGARVDLLQAHEASAELIEEEFLAQAFAGFLLMPKIAVLGNFTARGIRPETAGAVDFFKVANVFGVGFSTLVYHLRSIGVIGAQKAETLLNSSLAEIRDAILPGAKGNTVIPVDRHWTGRAIDLEIGDLVVADPAFVVEGAILATASDMPSALTAARVGHCRLHDPRGDWAAFARVSARNFEGRAIYRHLPDE